MQFHLEDMTCVEVQTSASQEQIAAALSEAGFPPRAQ